MDYWESGMDMKSGDDIYDSFRAYQVKLLREYKVLAREFGFRVLDARCPIDEIQAELRRQVGAFLAQSAQRSPSNAETPAEDDVERPAEPLQIRTQPPAEIEAVAAPERGSPRRRHHA
jgi:hypothetical protein